MRNRLFASWIVGLALVTLTAAPTFAQQHDVIWVANSAGNSVMKIQRGAAAVVRTVALPTGGPIGVAVDPTGGAWIANQSGAAIHSISSAGTLTGTYAVAGQPTSLALDHKLNVWVAPITGEVYKYSSSGTLLLTVSTPGIGVFGIAVDGAGDIWAADGRASRTWKISPAGTILLTLSYPAHRIPVVDHNDNIFTTGFGNGNARKYADDGTLLGTYPTPGFTSHQGMAVDREDNVWMTAQGTSVLKMSNTGTVLGSFASGGTIVVSAIVDGLGDIWVCNHGSGNVTHMKPDGTRVGGLITVGPNPFVFGDGSGFQRAVFTDPFGDVDMDGHRNNAEAVAGSNVFDAASIPCSLSCGGDRKPGGTATLLYTDLTKFGAGAPYAMACSLSNLGVIPISKKRQIDLVADGLFVLSLQLPTVFQNFAGTLNAAGRATGTIHIPNVPALKDLPLHCTAVTVDPTAPQGIRSIAPTNTFKIQ
ncbi:MAG: NHL repeat-containing protein [Polyangiaceae bacterium]|nr:NHL repeat-containing protein [Polyangiaceae bacterium]